MKLFLIIFGIIEIIIAIFVIYALLGPLKGLYSSLDGNQIRLIVGYIYFCLLLIIGFVQLARGLFFKNSNEKHSKYLFYTGLGLLILSIPVAISTVIYPIYGLLDYVV